MHVKALSWTGTSDAIPSDLGSLRLCRHVDARKSGTPALPCTTCACTKPARPPTSSASQMQSWSPGSRRPVVPSAICDSRRELYPSHSVASKNFGKAGAAVLHVQRDSGRREVLAASGDSGSAWPSNVQRAARYTARCPPHQQLHWLRSLWRCTVSESLQKR